MVEAIRKFISDDRGMQTAEYMILGGPGGRLSYFFCCGNRLENIVFFEVILVVFGIMR